MRRVPAACIVVAGLFLAALSTPPTAGSTLRTLPRPGAVVPAPPLLRWRAVSSARLYNMQLVRDGHKILSRWPARARFQLHRVWRYKGHRYRLTMGVYHWYVWPWFGSRYGRLRVRSYFIRAVVPSNTSPPAVSGTARESRTLTASTGAWRGTRPFRFSYSWERCDAGGGSCAHIAEANTAGYQLRSADAGKTVRVVVTATNLARSRSAASAPTVVVLPLPPANVTRPTIWGPLQQGRTLAAAAGGWMSSLPILSYSFTWSRCNRLGTTCRAIRGATQAAYTLTAADFEHRVRVLVTARNVGGKRKASSAVTPTIGQLILGTGGDDRLVGSLGADVIRARGGSDYVRGGAGSDRLRGGGGSDLLLGGGGSDVIFAFDRTADWVRCGPGRDRVVADRADRLSHCETVVRR